MLQTVLDANRFGMGLHCFVVELVDPLRGSFWPGLQQQLDGPAGIIVSLSIVSAGTSLL